ncbi:MAG: hypothetical protein HZA22_04665 [Nitrospirae bacterium]|nr:hypothetical protein [Nitrospirota bacterium]
MYKSPKNNLFGAKIVGAGIDVTPEILAKINRYALTPLTSEQVYVRKAIVAHSAVDRDNERFPEDLLDDYARTIPGKGYFNNPGGHPGSFGGQRGPGQGLWFDASTEEMTPPMFEEKTGERPKLAPGKTMIKVLWSWMYALKIADNEGMIANIEGGIHRHLSIGFGASDLVPVKDPGDQNRTLFYEYVGPGEAREASSVYLGAQHGAGFQKAAYPGCSHKHDEDDNPNGGDEDMDYKELYETTKKELDDARKKAADQSVQLHKAETDLAALKEAVGGNGTVEDVKAIKLMAGDGKAYRDSLVEKNVHAARLLGRIDDTPESTSSRKEFVGGWPIKHLEDETGVMLKELADKGLDKQQLPGGDGNDKRTKDAPGGQKDLTSPEHNDWVQ